MRGVSMCVRTLTQVSLSPIVRQDQSAASLEAHGAQPPPPASAPLAPLPPGGVMDGAPAEAQAPQRGDSTEADAAGRQESAAASGGSGTRTVQLPIVVGTLDTWQSLCLRHRMTSQELRSLNGLRNCRCRVGDVLLVWAERSDAQHTEDVHRQLVRQFRKETGCKAGEALYYLEQHDYQLGDALRERQHDHSFERERGVVVHTILAERAQAAEAEAAVRAEAEAAEAVAARAARAEAHTAALRPLSVCLPGAGEPFHGTGERPHAQHPCLACLG